MDYRELHHILHNLSAKLTCPHCKARIFGKYIRLVNVYEKECLLYVICPQCRANMVLGAHLDYQLSSPKKLTTNISTQIHKNKNQAQLNEAEMYQILNYFQNLESGFNSIFGEPPKTVSISPEIEK
jgi:hypothetical protein